MKEGKQTNGENVLIADVLIENEKMELYPVLLENRFKDRDAFVDLLWTKRQQVGKDTDVYLVTSYCEEMFEDAFFTTPICEKSFDGKEVYKLRYVVHPHYGLISLSEIKICPESCTHGNCLMSIQNIMDLIQTIAVKDRKAKSKVAPRLLIFYAERYTCGEGDNVTEIKDSWMIWDCSQRQRVKKDPKIRDINISLVQDYLEFMRQIENHPLPLSKASSDPEKESPALKKAIKQEHFITPIAEGRLIDFMKERSDDDVKAIIRRAIKAHRSEKIDREMLSMGRKDQVRIILELDLLLYDELFGDQATQLITKK